MIISASRRTDIPAFYAEWFRNRVQAGYCTVPNPFNHDQVAYVSLKPEDVDVIVFWTRNPAPLLTHLNLLDQIGLRYYFQFTVLNNPRVLDSKAPSLKSSLQTFKRLAERIGPERVIWRYDPIVFSDETGICFHEDTFGQIASQLCGYTHRVVISLVDSYKKTSKRLAELEKSGLGIYYYQGEPSDRFDYLMNFMAQTATNSGMEIFSCSEIYDLSGFGIQPGKCVDDSYIEKLFGVTVKQIKDPNQRAVCGCVVSKDIGMYDTCLFGCQYCYATSSFDRARKNFHQHDPNSPSLIGHYDAPLPDSLQPKLF